MAIELPCVLSFRGVREEIWNVSALVLKELGSHPPTLIVSDPMTTHGAPLIANVPLRSPKYSVYRCDLSVPLGGGQVELSIDGMPLTFTAPAKDESPRIAYASCNGFSDPRAMKGISNKNDRWQDLAKTHEQTPYHLLLLGGDQVYADEIWKPDGPLHNWTELPFDERVNAKWTARQHDAIDRFYCELYLKRWIQQDLQNALVKIPSVMMWDDHDIFDGWGSYPEQLHQSPVYQGVYNVACDYFRIFQQQLGADETHPAAIPGQSAFNLGFEALGKLAILVLDLRSERQPDLRMSEPQQPGRVMSQETAAAVYDWLDKLTGHRHLLVMSSIPVSYLDLGFLEKMLCALPGQQELEDDLRDHWRSESHLQERKRLIHRLLSHATNESSPRRVSVLSGDVHVAAASVIESSRREHRNDGRIIHQLISSAIVHPGPPGLVRYVLESIADRVEQIDRGITASMEPMGPKGTHLIGQRNWLAIEPDKNGALWFNWHVEDMVSPITKVIHPAVAT